VIHNIIYFDFLIVPSDAVPFDTFVCTLICNDFLTQSSKSFLLDFLSVASSFFQSTELGSSDNGGSFSRQLSEEHNSSSGVSDSRQIDGSSSGGSASI